MDDFEVRQHLADLTVVVYSRNRLGYLHGVVKYWSRWPVSVIVLDGSDQPVDKESFDAGEARLILHSEISINGRFSFAASQLDTPFACLHSDDDFTLARGAAQTIAWLKANPEISCVASDVLVFTESRESAGVDSGRSVMSEEPGQRLAEHFSDYRFSYFYGIQWASHLSIALNAVVEATACREFVEYPDDAAGYELGMEICGAALGRLSKSPDVLLLKRVGNEDRVAGGQRSNEWLEDPNAQLAVRAWRSILSQHLAPHLDDSESTVDSQIAEAMRLFCQQEKIKEQERARTLQLISAIARFLKPKSNTTRETQSSTLTSLLHRSHTFSFRALRGTYRASMKALFRPRPNVFTISELGCADPLDLQDVITILDGNYDRSKV